ncbi:signal peptidase I [Subtercola boreus]|uniref:Signal peptidase I n=1 Tax=Subtercola boreus TaxID=120213 RepID=A0A3E0VW78_9MICO|nr:LamG domain-containing protein [Subtercola boreus]RFA13739.1 signal peptidase I [Subtercola boreus]
MTGNAALGGRLTKRGLTMGVALALLLAGVFGVTAFTPGTSSAYTARITNNTDTAATAAFFTCTAAATSDRGSSVFQYYLNEASGSATASDSDGSASNGTYRGTMTSSTTTPIACPRDTGGAYTLNGSSSFISTATAANNPTTFSEELWFKTGTAGGFLMGLGDAQTAQSNNKDRVIYLNTSGQLNFATYNGANQVITSPASYADAKWHHVVATMSAGTGMRLYVDGVLVTSNTAFTTAQNFSGTWRIGYDSLVGWPAAPTNYYFTGSMRYAAVYSVVLSQTQITNHYNAGK